MKKIQFLCCFLFFSLALTQEESLMIVEFWQREGERWIGQAENAWWENGEGEWTHEGENIEGEASFFGGDSTNFRIYCNPDGPSGEVCSAVYEPVCAYVSGGRGYDYPNGCEACKDGADYYLHGECEFSVVP